MSSDASRKFGLGWIGAAAGADVVDGVRYTAVESIHLTNEWRVRKFEPVEKRNAPTVLKVLAYLIRSHAGRDELLIHEHRDQPEAGAQVPAGTVEPGEDVEAALWRELREETGVTNSELIDRIDVYEWFNAQTMQWQRRHVYQLSPSSEFPDQWEWRVRGTGEDAAMIFLCRWIPLEEAARVLSGDQGRSIPRVLHTVSDAK